jgi:hypothetical protein
MPTIRIWALESDNDAKAARCLANELVTHLQLNDISIQTVENRRFLKDRRIRGTLNDKLRKAVQNFLDQGEYVIFVIDSDSPMSLHQRRREPNSFINQIERIVRDRGFDGRVFFAPAIHELEAWLLTDCLGIFCYFASQRAQYRNNCRNKVLANQSFVRLLRNSQKGNTESIVETEAGGNGPKEYLEEFSEQILRALNPNMPQKNVNRERYHERMSPDVAKYVVIDKETLRRNNSLRELGNVLAKFK